LLREAQQKFLDGLRNGCPGHCAIELLRPHLGSSGALLTSKACDETISTPSSSWIVLPFSSVFEAAGLGGKIKKLYHEWSSRLQASKDGARLNPGIAWSLGGRHLFRVLLSMKKADSDSVSVDSDFENYGYVDSGFY
jgi:hypothetical protein